MPSTEVEIANLALSYVGESKFIGALTDQSLEAQLCALHYETARDLVLTEQEWNFSTTRKALGVASLAAPPEWQYRYGYPDDCLVARRIEDVLQRRAVDQAIAFEIEGAAAGDTSASRYILTDEPEAVLIYTRRVENAGLFPPGFVEALSWKLAERVAMPLTKSAQTLSAMHQGYMQAVAAASALIAREGVPAQRPESRFTRARR